MCQATWWQEQLNGTDPETLADWPVGEPIVGTELVEAVAEAKNAPMVVVENIVLNGASKLHYRVSYLVKTRYDEHARPWTRTLVMEEPVTPGCNADRDWATSTEVALIESSLSDLFHEGAEVGLQSIVELKG